MRVSGWRTLYGLLAPAGANARLSTLIFHRVLPEPDPLLPDEPSAAEFERRIRWVQQQFNVLALDEAVTRLADGTLPERALAISFDDGYADNEQIAAPILRKLGAPATFFISTGYLDGGRMFNDTVIAAARDCKRSQLDLSALGFGVHVLESLEHRRRFVSVLLPQLKALPPDQRATSAERVCQLAEVTPPSTLMMTSPQVASLAHAGFTIGGHTVSHPILANIGSDVARNEIDLGKQQLEVITGKPVRLFAYPNGRPDQDYTCGSVELVKSVGFLGAFTTSPGVAGRLTDLHQLPRFTPWDRGNLKFGLRMARNLMQAPTISVRAQ